MKHFKLLLASLALCGAVNANAQTDVTSQYVVNPGFEACTPATGNQAAGKTTTGIDYTDDGWTFLYDHGAETWAMSAVLSYGTDGQINGAAIPATDNEGNSGNALGVSVGWGHSFYYQSATAITLPAGHYDLKVYAYNNNNGATQLKSLFGFIATNGTSYLSTKTSFTQGAWVTDVVSFDLTEDTEGKFQIGGQAISGGSGSNAKVFFDNITLTYTDPDQAIKDAYNNALQEAKDAIANEDYNNVTGEERSSLEDAISTYDEITSGYEEATTALKNATSAFTAAKSAYDAYVAAIQYPELPYASAEKKAAVEQACGESPATASEATEKTAAIYQALRAYYESHALAENYAGATNVTNLIQNPDATDGNNGWTWTGNKNNPRNTESWTDSKGVNNYMYFDGGNWSGTGWTTTMEQEITIPAGRYLLTAKGRASDGVTLTMYVGEESVELPNVNATGNVFDRGWCDGSVEFETNGDPITILVKATTAGFHQWFSVGDFRLVQLEEIEVPMADDADYAALYEVASYYQDLELGFDLDEYAPYNNVEAVLLRQEIESLDPEKAANYEYTKEYIQGLTEAVQALVVVPNEEELNAVYDGDFALQEAHESGDNVVLPGWTTVSGNTRLILKDTETYPAVADADAGAALFVHPGVYEYGHTSGYTLPLNGGELYELTFKYCAWQNGSNNNFTATIKNAAGETVASESFGKVQGGLNTAGSLKAVKMYFTPAEDGDFILSLNANGNSAFTDVKIMKTVKTDLLILSTDIAAPEEQYAGTVTTDRILLEGLNTLVLPFETTKEEIGAATVLEYTGTTIEADGLTLNFTEVESLSANVPYAVMMAADATETLSFVNKEVVPAEELIVEDENFSFVGTYTDIAKGNDVVKSGDYVAGAQAFKKAKGGNRVAAYRAYLKKAEEAPEAKIAFNFDGTIVDGIEAVEILNKLSGNIYNLNGQKLQKAQKGVNIINGKKVLVK